MSETFLERDARKALKCDTVKEWFKKAGSQGNPLAAIDLMLDNYPGNFENDSILCAEKITKWLVKFLDTDEGLEKAKAITPVEDDPEKITFAQAGPRTQQGLEILKVFGMWDFIGNMVNQLSGDDEKDVPMILKEFKKLSFGGDLDTKRFLDVLQKSGFCPDPDPNTQQNPQQNPAGGVNMWKLSLSDVPHDPKDANAVQGLLDMINKSGANVIGIGPGQTHTMSIGL